MKIARNERRKDLGQGIGKTPSLSYTGIKMLLVSL